MLRSKRMYDVCFISRQGLPLPQRALTKLLIESVTARLLKDDDVIVCNYVWMSNHPHLQLYSLDGRALSNFHGRMKKTLTDHLKRLLGLSHLRLWNNRSTLGETLDLEAAIERIVYTYCNPADAGIVRSIDDYEGCNTWKEFLAAPPDVNAVIEKEVPWIRTKDLEALSCPNPSLSEEFKLIQLLLQKAEDRTHTLKIHPFKWLEAFNIKDPKEIEGIRQRIIARVREEEEKLRSDKPPLRRLEGFDITDAYLPPPEERKVFMYGSTKEVRVAHLKECDVYRERCRNCYSMMKQGAKNIPWPLECFIPPSPRLANPF